MSKKELSIQIIKVLRDKGFEAVWAGGCVRDHLLGIEPQDYDVATNATPRTIQQTFTKTVPVGERFGVVLVIIDGMSIEVATFRAEDTYSDGRHPDRIRYTNMEEDALRRDFTINGMYYNPITNQLFDFIDGKKDLLQNKLIRTIGNPKKRFEEDKLRLLRAIRFAARFQFDIESKTYKALCSLSATITHISSERIGDEIIKIFTGANADIALDLLDETSLLKEILPEIKALQGVDQPPEFHPEGDVFIHTRLLLKKLNRPSPTLALGALFHDIGKPSTFKKTDRIRFNKHEKVGAVMTEKICKRLKISKNQTKEIVSCVKNHMKFKDLKNMREGKLIRFLIRENFETELELHRIDCLSSHGSLDVYEFCKTKLAEINNEAIIEKPYISGNDLIELGEVPSKQFKHILNKLYEMQLEGTWKDRNEALKFLRKNLLKMLHESKGETDV